MLKLKNMICIIFLALFIGLLFKYYWHNYRQVNVYMADNTAPELQNSVYSLRKELLKSKPFLSKPIDLYLANFTENNPVLRVKNRDHINVVWLGSVNGHILLQNLQLYDVVLTSSEELYKFLKNQNIKSFLFPVFVSLDKINSIEPRFFAVIGNPPIVEDILVKHNLLYKKYQNIEDLNILEDMPYFKMAFIDNTALLSSSSDIHPLFLKLAYNRIPLASFWWYPIKFEPIELFNERINYYAYENEVESLISNFKADDIVNRAIDAQKLVVDYYSVIKATRQLLYIIENKTALEPLVDKYTLNVDLPISVGHFSAGDYWLASDLLMKFRDLKWQSHISFFNSLFVYPSEVNIILRGYIPFVERSLSGKINILYLAYATEDVIDNLGNYVDVIKNMFNKRQIDALAISSFPLFEILKKENYNVFYVPQFTNTDRFYPDFDESIKSEVLFVGNNFAYREAATNILNAGLPISIYGDYWPDGVAKAKYIDNRILRKYYSSAKIVLNDAREGTKKAGFIINRIYDATACGTLVISDYMKEIEDIYGDSIPMWKTKEELIELVRYYLASEHEAERLEKANRARDITLNNFTTDIVSHKFMEIINKVKKEKGLD